MASDQRPPRAQSPLQTQAQPKQTPRALGPSPLDESPARQWSALAALGPARGPGLLLLAAGLLLGSQAPALAGSVTAESIWDRSNAIDRATSQIPSGATVTGNSCQEVDLRGGSTRYICTVTYSPAPPATATSPAAGPSASPSEPGANGASPSAPNAPAP